MTFQDCQAGNLRGYFKWWRTGGAVVAAQQRVSPCFPNNTHFTPISQQLMLTIGEPLMVNLFAYQFSQKLCNVNTGQIQRYLSAVS